MKLPLPPTGGQGGHYGFGATGRTRLFDGSHPGDTPQVVPRRFRRLRLRRRRRSRVMAEHPGMTVLVAAILLMPFLFAAGLLPAILEWILDLLG
jgi:hypothetical protein